MPFMTGLPNVVVNDFEIFYPTNKLRAGTYGRGVWETDLYSNPLAPPDAFYSTSSSSLCISTPAVLNDQSSNTPTAWSWTLTGATPSVSAVKNPTVSYGATGVYTVSLTSTNVNGTSTIYSNTIAVVSSPTISVTSGTVCSGAAAVLTASGASTYNWSTGASGNSLSVSPSVTTVYTCTGYVGACTSVQTTTVTVGAVPPTPTVTQIGSVLNSSSSTGNQWYFNGSPIAGATAQTYTTTQDGYYSVWVTSSLGCQSSSNSVYISTVGLEELTFVNGIAISPNPAKDILFLNSTTKEQKRVSYTIYAVNGQLVKSGNVILNSGKETISISELVKGIYEITFIADKHSSSFKFIKE
jgi:PKD repeat protein